MDQSAQPILVFGTKEQQGGSVAKALLSAGWPVRGLVRDTGSYKALALRAQGVDLYRGEFDDHDAMRAATPMTSGDGARRPRNSAGR